MCKGGLPNLDKTRYFTFTLWLPHYINKKLLLPIWLEKLLSPASLKEVQRDGRAEPQAWHPASQACCSHLRSPAALAPFSAARGKAEITRGLYVIGSSRNNHFSPLMTVLLHFFPLQNRDGITDTSEMR